MLPINSSNTLGLNIGITTPYAYNTMTNKLSPMITKYNIFSCFRPPVILIWRWPSQALWPCRIKNAKLARPEKQLEMKSQTHITQINKSSNRPNKSLKFITQWLISIFSTQIPADL